MVCSKCEKCEEGEGEPVYQGILEVNTKQGENTEIASLQVIIIYLIFLIFLCNIYLQADVTRLTSELTKARQMCSALKDKEENLKEQLLAEKKKKKKSELDVAEPGKSGGTLSSYDKRPAALVRKYGELYAQTRLETLESLDKLSELNNHDDLKSKLLFSVIVVRSLS